MVVKVVSFRLGEFDRRILKVSKGYCSNYFVVGRNAPSAKFINYTFRIN